MKILKCLLPVILAGCTTTSFSGQISPPARYDHAYKGKMIVRMASTPEVNRACHGGGACTIALALRHGVCSIVLPNDQPAYFDAYRRHEIAHCNGWRH
jgi:hypothetical protein